MHYHHISEKIEIIQIVRKTEAEGTKMTLRTYEWKKNWQCYVKSPNANDNDKSPQNPSCKNKYWAKSNVTFKYRYVTNGHQKYKQLWSVIAFSIRIISSKS